MQNHQQAQSQARADDPLYGYKGEARRLAKALQELKLPVTHSQALDLIGRVHGQRDWKELSGLTTSRIAMAVEAHADAADRLTYLEFWLRVRGVSEEDLDMLVHEYAASHLASSINNSGLYAQLEFLFENACGKDFDALQRMLADDSDITCELDWSKPGVPMRAWGPNSATVHVDALPWLLSLDSGDALRTLLSTSRGGHLGNCDVGDTVAEWLREHGDEATRAKLEELYRSIKAAQTLDEDALGITVSISGPALRRYIACAFQEAERQSLLDAFPAY